MSSAQGHVETQRVVLFTQDDPLVLRSGETLGPVEVAYETYGELSPERDNAVFICHALTGGANASGLHLNAKKRGWWDNMIGPGKPVDTGRFFAIAANILGGCSGTTGPSSTNPKTGAAYGLDFPKLSMSDLITVHRALLAHLGIEHLFAAIGGSLGGMQVLQWAIDAPEQVERAVMVAASSLLSAQNIAFSAVGRQAIMTDPDFHDGQYVAHHTAPAVGMKVARMMAHITYVSDRSMTAKFGRRRRDPDGPQVMGPDFEVEHYLDHQGVTFLDRFDPLSYLYLSRLLDYFDPFAEPGVDDVLAGSATRFLAISFDSDWRFDTSQSLRIVENLERLGVPIRFREIDSPWGHDSFLLEPPGYHDEIRQFLA